MAGGRVGPQPGALTRLALAGALGLLLAGSAHAYEVATVTDGGTISGVVRFAGSVPRLEPLPVNKNRDVCGEQKASEALVVAADQGVKGAVVLVEGVTRGKRANGDVVVDNHKCLFVSHVTVVTPGERTRVKNSDPILHDTHGYLARTTVFNLALPNQGQMIDITKRLTKPGVIRVVCDAHPHMFAWLIVHDSPYYAVTGEHGAFRIDGVPPGAWKVTMWHQGFRSRGSDKDGRPLYDEARTITKEITLAPRGSASVDFELK